MRPIQEIAQKLGITDEWLEPYGHYTGKLRLELLEQARNPAGKLILVTATTPTVHGEGKTVTTIGLAQALERLGTRAVATLREPSLGPVFGQKGGATGGGLSQVLPREKINLNFHGDFPAIAAAHNLLAAVLDSHLLFGNELDFDVTSLTWPRTVDMNDRALRDIVVGLGGRANGVPRETGFVITAASEIMAILALAGSRRDLRERLGSIVVGLDRQGRPVRAEALQVTGAQMVLLEEALLPNLVQTTEGTPATIHCGPFANIAHGTSSVISQRMGLGLADYVVNECGFAAELGAEKYFDIVMPASGLRPSVAVLVTSARALAAQGAGDGIPRDEPAALEAGFANLRKHVRILETFHVPVVVAINRFADDTAAQLERIAACCGEMGVPCAPSDVFARGGEGGLELAEIVRAVADSAHPERLEPLYDAPALSLEAKLEKIARDIYGAEGVSIASSARGKLKQFERLGFAHLPVCVAKTQSSISDNPKLAGAPAGWTLRITDASLSAGAGFVVAIAGNMLLMPGLPRNPQALAMDVDDETGAIRGLR